MAQRGTRCPYPSRSCPWAVETGRALSGRTGAAAGLQVDGESLFGEVPAAGWFGHLGDQDPFGFGQLPATLAIPVGGGHDRRQERAPCLGVLQSASVLPWMLGSK